MRMAGQHEADSRGERVRDIYLRPRPGQIGSKIGSMSNADYARTRRAFMIASVLLALLFILLVELLA